MSVQRAFGGARRARGVDDERRRVGAGPGRLEAHGRLPEKGVEVAINIDEVCLEVEALNLGERLSLTDDCSWLGVAEAGIDRFRTEHDRKWNGDGTKFVNGD